MNDRLTLNPGLRLDHVARQASRTATTSTATPTSRRASASPSTSRATTRPSSRAATASTTRGSSTTSTSGPRPGLGDFITYDASGCPPFPAHLRPRQPGGDRPGPGHPSTGSIPTSSTRGWTRRSLGFERALSSDVRLSVTGIYRDNKNIIGSVNPAARWTPTTVTNGLGQPMTPLPLGEPRRASETAQSSRTPTASSSWTRAATCWAPSTPSSGTRRSCSWLSKRFTNRWQAQVSYVLSKSYGTVDNTSEGSFGANSSTNGGGGTRQYETPNVSLVNANGELTNSRRHELKAHARASRSRWSRSASTPTSAG